MSNEEIVHNWQAAILRECRRILGRELTSSESALIEKRGGFIALEVIEDTVHALSDDPKALERYLRSEEDSQQ